LQNFGSSIAFGLLVARWWTAPVQPFSVRVMQRIANISLVRSFSEEFFNQLPRG